MAYNLSVFFCNSCVSFILGSKRQLNNHGIYSNPIIPAISFVPPSSVLHLCLHLVEEVPTDCRGAGLDNI